MYADESQKTKKCPGCNKTINLKIVKKLKYVNDIQVAIEIIKQLKTPKEIREKIKVLLFCLHQILINGAFSAH